MVFPDSGGPQFIRAYHGCYDPLAYPILYPGGETGWEDKSRRKYTKRKSEGIIIDYSHFILKLVIW